MRCCVPSSSPARIILGYAALSVLLSVSAAGLVQTTIPQPVTSSADLAFVAAQSDLHIASNGSNQYALWEDESQRWFGIELTRDGKPIVSTQRLFADRTAFDVTSAGGEFFVLSGDAHSLWVSRIGADGRMLSEATLPASPIEGALTTNGARLFAIWQNNDGSIHRVIVDRSLIFVTDDLAMTGTNRSTTVIVATTLGDRALAFWRNDNLGANAALIDPTGTVTNIFSGIIDSFDQPAIASNGSDARILWHAGSGVLFEMTVNASQGDPATRTQIATNAIGPSDIMWDGTNYRAVWQVPGCGAIAYDVVGGILGDTATSISAGQPAGPGPVRIVRTLDDAYVAWLATSCDFAAEVATGRLLGGDTVSLNSFSLGFPNQITPDVVVANGDTFTIWSENGEIRVARPNGPATIITPVGSKPQIAFDGAQLLVAWIDENKQVIGRFFNTKLAFVGLQFKIADSAESFALDWNGSTYTAVMDAQRVASITTNGVVTPVPSSAILFIAPAGSNPHFACGVGDCLVTWSVQGKAFGERVANNGTVLDQIIVIANGVALPMWNGKFYRVVTNDGTTISTGPFGGKLEPVIMGQFSDFAIAPKGDRVVIVYSQVRAYVIEAEQTLLKRRTVSR